MQKEVQNTSYEVFLPNIENESIKPLTTTVQETQGTEEHVKQHSGDISAKSSTWKTLQMTHFLQKKQNTNTNKITKEGGTID